MNVTLDIYMVFYIMIIVLIIYFFFISTGKDFQGMSFKGKLRHGRYALLTAAVLACIGAPHGYAAEDVSGGGG